MPETERLLLIGGARAARVTSACSGSLAARALGVCALILSGTFSCSTMPTGPSSGAEFVVADRSDAGPGLALVNIAGTEYRRITGPGGGPVWMPDGHRDAVGRVDAQFCSRV